MMIASFIILGLSVCMFAYWFRYTCLLVLQRKPRRDYARRVISRHGLTFRNLPSDTDEEIERLLRRDYRVLRHLVARCKTDHVVELVVLKVDYALMWCWWRLIRNLAPVRAKRAVDEMVRILENVATIVGQASAPNTATTR